MSSFKINFLYNLGNLQGLDSLNLFERQKNATVGTTHYNYKILLIKLNYYN